MADYHRGCVVVRDLEGKPNAELAEEFFDFLKKNGQNGFENGWKLNRELSVVCDVVNTVEKTDIQSGSFCDYTGDYASYHAVGTGLGEGTACRTEDYEKWIFKTMKDFNGENPKCNLVATTVWDDEANLLFSRFYCALCGTREFHMWDFQLEMEDGGDEYGTVFVDGDEQVHDCPDDSPDSIIENFGAEEEEEEKEEEKGGLVYSDGMKTVKGVAKKDITEAVIADGVTEIGSEAFEDCTSLASIVIPSSVKKIDQFAFIGCKSLKEITFGGTKLQWFVLSGFKSVPEDAMVHCSDGDAVNPKTATEFTIPEGVTKIGVSAFWCCESLQSVAIPASVTEIDDGAFIGCAIEELNHPCLAIKGGIAVHDGVAYCANVNATEVTIPEGVTKIRNKAFFKCESLASVTIPASVTEIGVQACYNCKAIAQITFGGTMEQWNAVKKGSYWNGGVPAKSVKCSDGEAAL